MEWNHILDKQPENESIIIQVDSPFELYKGNFKNHYCMGMREYNSYGSWEEYIKWCEDNGWSKPNYWWIYAKDFPFPHNPVEALNNKEK